MLKILKKYFVPHTENDHKPHILRNEATLVIVGLLLMVEISFLAGAGILADSKSFFAKILSNVLIDETNNSRVNEHLASLSINPLLEKAAQEKAEDMARNGYFSHISPDGKTPWQWLQGVGYDYSYAGENLAVNFIDSMDVVNAWMNSPGHRANILNGNYTEIGIGTATGTYKGKETVFIAQYFGKPLLPNSSNNFPKINVAEASSNEIPKVTPAATPAQLKPTTTPEITPISTPEPKQVAVLGESNDQNKESSFIATESPNAKFLTQVLPITNAGSSEVVKHSSLLEKVLASPRAMANGVLVTFAAMIALALALKIFIKFEIQHPPLILNGLIMILIIISALVINRYLGFVSAQVL